MKLKQRARKSTSISCLNAQVRLMNLKSKSKNSCCGSEQPGADSSDKMDDSIAEYRSYIKKIDLEKLLEAEKPKPAAQRNRSSARDMAMARQVTLENIIESKRRSPTAKPPSSD